MSIFDSFKPKLGVASVLRHHGLAGWWQQEFNETERKYIENAYQPMSSDQHEEKPLTRGRRFSTKDSTVIVLITLADWFKKDVNRSIPERFFAQAEPLLPLSTVRDQHFAYQALIDFHYRDFSNPKSLAKTVNYCRRQIAIAPAVKAMLRKHVSDVLPDHTGYRQLSIILDYAGKFDEAIEICEQAKRQGWAGDWDQRIERYQKLSKVSSAGFRD